MNHLQGASAKTDAWHFRVSSGNNYLITLSDAAGAQKFSIRDSAGVEQFSVDSDGNVTATALTPTTLTLPSAAAPAQTTDAQIKWDSDDDMITVGTGAATKYVGLSRGAGSDASATKELMYDTTAAVLKVWNGSASKLANPLPNIIQDFVEGGVNKGFIALGPASAAGSYADGDHVGLGFIVQEDVTSAVVGSTGTPNLGAWTFGTGSTSGEDAGVIGPYRAAANDWTLVWRGNIPSAASQTIFIGCRTTGGTFADENSIIGFRVSGTGNIFGVCDSGGTETTRDAGATGATECTLRIEVRAAGTIVRFYKDNVQIGADVTTNIPTGTLITAAGIVNSTTADKTMFTHDLYGWMEA